MEKECPECGSTALEYLPNVRCRCLECLIEWDDWDDNDQPPMDEETAGDRKYHELKDEGRLDRFGRRKWDE